MIILYLFSSLEIHFLFFMYEFREGTYPGFLPVYRGSVTPVLPEILYYTINHY